MPFCKKNAAKEVHVSGCIFEVGAFFARLRYDHVMHKQKSCGCLKIDAGRPEKLDINLIKLKS